MKLNDFLTILAIFLGPISALFVQRKLDDRRESNKRKKDIFRTIWATRTFPQRLNYRHVEALNVVGNDFANDSKVIDAWKEYLDKLNSPLPTDTNLHTQFFEARDEKFNELIFQMSQTLGYKFTRLEIKKQYYSPQAHGTWAEQETVLRNGVTSLFKGEFSLPIRITEEPPPKKK